MPLVLNIRLTDDMVVIPTQDTTKVILSSSCIMSVFLELGRIASDCYKRAFALVLVCRFRECNPMFCKHAPKKSVYDGKANTEDIEESFDGCLLPRFRNCILA